MALNIAVPLSGVGEFFEGFGLLSPISPISVDCRENLKLLVSPIESESSGVSSLDPEESKEKKTPTKDDFDDSEDNDNDDDEDDDVDENDDDVNNANIKMESEIPVVVSDKSDEQTNKKSEVIDEKIKTDEKLLIETAVANKNNNKQLTEDEGTDEDELVEMNKAITIVKPEPVMATPVLQQKPIEPIKPPKELKIMYQGRDILDLGANLRDPKWNMRSTYLPENDFKMFLANRSIYHRLGPSGHIQEYSLLKCQCCDFRYPVNQYSFTSGPAVAANNISTSLTTNLANHFNNAIITNNNFNNNNVVNPSSMLKAAAVAGDIMNPSCSPFYGSNSSSTFNQQQNKNNFNNKYNAAAFAAATAAAALAANNNNNNNHHMRYGNNNNNNGYNNHSMYNNNMQYSNQKYNNFNGNNNNFNNMIMMMGGGGGGSGGNGGLYRHF